MRTNASKDEKRFKRNLNKARRTNSKRDKMERDAGFATPYDGPLSLQLKTVVSALSAGMISEHWEPIYEGLAMLQVIIANIKEIEGESPKMPQDKKLFTDDLKPEEIDKMADVIVRYLGNL